MLNTKTSNRVSLDEILCRSDNIGSVASSIVFPQHLGGVDAIRGNTEFMLSVPKQVSARFEFGDGSHGFLDVSGTAF